MPARAGLAGFAYFLGVFAVGFALGALRIFLLEPALGPLLAVLLELPVILGAAWWICARLIRTLGIADRVSERSVMGASAFVFLIAAELLLSRFAFGVTLTEVLEAWTTPAGAIGLAGQVVFALFPILAGGKT